MSPVAAMRDGCHVEDFGIPGNRTFDRVYQRQAYLTYTGRGWYGSFHVNRDETTGSQSRQYAESAIQSVGPKYPNYISSYVSMRIRIQHQKDGCI